MTLYSQDFSRITAAIERGSYQSADEFIHDLVATGQDEEGGDKYGIMKDFEKPMMSMGKAVTRNRGLSYLPNSAIRKSSSFYM